MSIFLTIELLDIVKNIQNIPHSGPKTEYVSKKFYDDVMQHFNSELQTNQVLAAETLEKEKEKNLLLARECKQLRVTIDSIRNLLEVSSSAGDEMTFQLGEIVKICNIYASGDVVAQICQVFTDNSYKLQFPCNGDWATICEIKNMHLRPTSDHEKKFFAIIVAEMSRKLVLGDFVEFFCGGYHENNYSIAIIEEIFDTLGVCCYLVKFFSGKSTIATAQNLTLATEKDKLEYKYMKKNYDLCQLNCLPKSEKLQMAVNLITSAQ